MISKKKQEARFDELGHMAKKVRERYSYEDMAAIVLDEFILAMLNRSIPRLDFLGVSVAISDDALTSAPVLDLARLMVYGRGRWGRLWAQKIRPRLFPKLQAEMMRAYKAAREIYQAEYMSVILDNCEQRLKEFECEGKHEIHT